jgi:hypothetical protein
MFKGCSSAKRNSLARSTDCIMRAIARTRQARPSTLPPDRRVRRYKTCRASRLGSLIPPALSRTGACTSLSSLYSKTKRPTVVTVSKRTTCGYERPPAYPQIVSRCSAACASRSARSKVSFTSGASWQMISFSGQLRALRWYQLRRGVTLTDQLAGVPPNRQSPSHSERLGNLVCQHEGRLPERHPAACRLDLRRSTTAAHRHGDAHPVQINGVDCRMGEDTLLDSAGSEICPR